MWHPSTFIFHVAVISMVYHGVFATKISFCSEKFEEDLRLYFEEPMDKCDNPQNESVNLVNMGLQVVRENFIGSVNVRSINLEENNIVDISLDAFKAVPNLSCLNIGRNRAVNIFSKFLKYFNHPSLTKLNLYQATSKNTLVDYVSQRSSISNHDPAIPSKGYLPHVTHLDMSRNNLIDFPNYLQPLFPRLTHLYLSDNRLYRKSYYIPASTQVLYFERNQNTIFLSDIPINITALFISENYVNDYFRRFTKLNVLSFRKCKNCDYSLISQIGDCENLVNLDISSNNINFIPEHSFKKLKSLQRFSLDRNSLSSLSFLTHLSTLTDLSIAYNNLTNITSDSFTYLVNLKSLNLRGNRIAIISKNAFTHLKILEKLDLAENNLTNLPVTWMNTLTRLRYLNLKSNLFTSIDSISISRYSNLNHLFVHNNSFTQIEMESLVKLPTTVVVYVS